MAAPATTLWALDPHTQAKHQLLGGYLDAWFPIIAKQFGSLTYAEGFAGPDEYHGGESGSPSLALRRGHRPDLAETTMRFVFIEENKKRFEHLQGRLESEFPTRERPKRMTISTRHGCCERDLIPTLDAAGAWGQPVFANLDGWGVDTESAVVKRIGENKASEVMVTMAPSFFMRFATLEDQEAGDRVFGHARWRAVASEETPQAKRLFLVDEYRDVLRSAGFRFTLLFEMLDEGGHELYLFYGTANPVGLEKMKDSMWKIDPNYGQRFRDPRDPAQLAFAIDQPQITPLMDNITDLLAKRGPQRVEDIKTFTILETIYRRPHASEALKLLQAQDRVLPATGRLTKDVVVSLA